MRAEAQDFLQDCMCIKRRLRSACASAQSVQSLQGNLWVAIDPKRLQGDNEDSDPDCADVQADLSVRWTHNQALYKESPIACFLNIRTPYMKHFTILSCILVSPLLLVDVLKNCPVNGNQLRHYENMRIQIY